MARTDADRLTEEALRPRVVALHFALARLASCVSFMNTGAHPDDETSAMLAALGFRDGLDLSYACANRGEGGQNDIGTEATEDLGTLRTAEMERAAEVLDLRLYWLSERPDDTLFDFGFSKRGTETFERWGRERTLRRFVEIVRVERPDILCPTFLDVPGQHGHHRAMTEAAHRVMDLAADPGFETPGLAPWRPAKLYLPAWGGGGSAYDDETPPPATTLSVEASGIDPVTGWSFERIGQQSRRFHATQGMGRWVAAGEERDWPLHLARSEVAGPDVSLSSGLPATLGELAAFAGAEALGAPLAEAQAAIDEARDASLALDAVLAAATRALGAVRGAREDCPPGVREQVLHRLARKEAQLARVIRLAAGVDVRGRVASERLRPGERTTLVVERRDGSARVSARPLVERPWAVTPTDVRADESREGAVPGKIGGTVGSSSGAARAGDAGDAGVAGVAGDAGDAGDADDVGDRGDASLGADPSSAGGRVSEHELRLDDDASPSDPYPSTWLPDEPPLPALEIRVDALGERSVTRVALETTPIALPARSATLAPDAWLLNLSAEPVRRRFEVRVGDVVPAGGEVAFALPAGWRQERTADGLVVHAPDALEAGLHELPLTVDGEPALEERHVDHAHVRPALRARPATLRVRALEVALPSARVGYVGGGNDRVARHLGALGVDVVELERGALDAEEALADIDTLVVGLFALRTRPDLARAMPRVHAWVERGGHLLTLYHRPWDDWDPARSAPRPLEIGQPSLRWRVTDERAEITALVPDHPLLNAPNRIGADDWAGWHKERGLYFAKSWDAAYVPLLSMADPDEPPHEGALLSAEIGEGRHTHTSLILHHQMERLVPGAFRLMANLVA